MWMCAGGTRDPRLGAGQRGLYLRALMLAPVRYLPLLLLALTACLPTVDPGEPPAPTGGTDAGVAPETRLLGGPADAVAQTDARFTFDADVADATFECSLDGAAFAACSSPHDEAALAQGAHTFRVRALRAGLVDASPASRSWSVDTVGPETVLSSGPSGTVASTSASFTFLGAEAASFECSLDGAAFSACTSPQQYTGLAQDAHVFRVRALDALGNADASPAERGWSVDTLSPHARITDGPSGTTAATSASFSFEGSGDVSGFECALDGAAYAGCSSPVQLNELSDLTHTFQVRALSATRPASAPDLRSWTVDTQAPETGISAGPAEGSTQASASATFTFTSSEAGSSFECALDGAAFAACTSPHDEAALAQGLHTLRVRALDAVQNRDATPAMRTWTVDVPPVVRVRLMAANITAGNGQSYTAEGVRIFQGLEPDIVMIQEFNVSASVGTIDQFVDTAFGTGFEYYRESQALDSLPNGIISRYPIRESGEWDDPTMENRDFVWARIDVPGSKDLWVVSLHLKASSGSEDKTQRNTEATELVRRIQEKIPPGDYLALGGDLNTYSRLSSSEACLGTLSQVVLTSGPYPVDQRGDGDTNASRGTPYDWVLADADLAPRQTAVVIGNSSYADGLVFDSRVYTPLAEVSPVLVGDSGVLGMQHMAVVKDFLIPTN
jgi:endonuclease/exonuclease/phosphatase family metal-dependent hydrolase